MRYIIYTYVFLCALIEMRGQTVHSFEQETGNIVNIDLDESSQNVSGNLVNATYWNASTFDLINNHYVVSSNEQIFIIDPLTATVVNNYSLDSDLVGFEYSELYDRVYAFEQGTGSLFSINLNDGTISNIGVVEGATYWNASTFIQSSSQYVLSSNEKLFIIDVLSADIIDSFVLDNSFVGFEYSEPENKIYAFEQLAANFVKIDLSNGFTTVISTIPGASFWNASTFSSNSNQYIISSNGQLSVIDGQTGSVVNDVIVSNSFVGFEVGLSSTSSIDLNSNENNVSIFPNPFSFHTSINFSDVQSNTSIVIRSIQGKVIREYNFSGKQMKLTKDEMIEGTYLVIIETDRGALKAMKLIVQ